jgi:hypothetical protein
VRIALRADGPVAADAVWQRYLVPACWSTWAPHITGVDCTDQVITATTTGRVRTLFGLSLPFDVLDLDHAARSWRWSVHGPYGMRMTLRHTVTATAEGSATDLAVYGPPVLVLGYAPVAQLALHRLVTLPTVPAARPPR